MDKIVWVRERVMQGIADKIVEYYDHLGIPYLRHGDVVIGFVSDNEHVKTESTGVCEDCEHDQDVKEGYERQREEIKE